MTDLAGKTALVTGGSRGIGAAIAKRLARDGADVALTYRAAEAQAQAVVKELEAAGQRGVAIRADVADAQDVAGAVEQTVSVLGRIDILVNNAGIFDIGPLEEFTLERVDASLDVHARAAFLGAQAAAAHMERGGRIISIGSNLVERAPHSGLALYSMSKAALTGLTKGLARDLGPRGITANLVHPGSTDTDMNPADGPHAEDQRSGIALGHYGHPDDIAATVAHLASDEARNITGASIVSDGGRAV